MARSGAEVGSLSESGSSSQYVRLDLRSWDVTFALRTYEPETNRHAVGLSATGAKEAVLYSPRLQRIMREVCKDENLLEKDVKKEANEILNEIGHSMFVPSVRFLALILRPFVRSALRGIIINSCGLQEFREVVTKWPVVLLPSHRSYLDFLLISYIMFEHNIKLPYIAAGQDFMKMKLVSSLLRQSGAFFMRRTFGADRLYKAVFSEYVKTVLCSNDAPVEFFLEGTRSRTAKTLHPKLGLLSMVVEPYLTGLVPDIMLVPVSISYQRTLEESLFTRELLGVPKPPESTRGLMKALSMIREDYGSIYVEFGQPISLHEFCTSRGVSRIHHTIYPKHKSVVLSHERQVILELSHVILDHTNCGMHIFPTAMTAALVLHNSSGVQRRDLMDKLRWLKTLVTMRGSRIHWEEGGENLEFALTTLSGSLEIVDDIIRPLQLTPPLEVRGHGMREILKMELKEVESQKVMGVAFSRLLLSHYRNQLLHLFVEEAILALSLSCCLPCAEATALKKFQTLHLTLTKEFVLPLSPPKDVFASSLMGLVDRGYLSLSRGDSDGTTIAMNEEREMEFGFLCSLVQPFVEGVWVVCHHLLTFGNGVQSLSTTIRGAQSLGVKCLYTGMVKSHDLLSLDLIRNALSSLTQLGLIRQPESEVEGRDRLVKVEKQDHLVQLTSDLASILGHDDQPISKL